MLRNLDKITEAQKHIKDLNALGKAWIQWLGSTEGKQAMDEIASKFDATRTEYLEEIKGSINAGRIATNAAYLSLIWKLLGKWPVTSKLANYESTINDAIKNHIIRAKQDIAEHQDAEKFISWLRAEVEIGHYSMTLNPKPVFSFDPYAKHIGLYRVNTDSDEKESELRITPFVFSLIAPSMAKVRHWGKSR